MQAIRPNPAPLFDMAANQSTCHMLFCSNLIIYSHFPPPCLSGKEERHALSHFCTRAIIPFYSCRAPLFYSFFSNFVNDPISSKIRQKALAEFCAILSKIGPACLLQKPINNDTVGEKRKATSYPGRKSHLRAFKARDQAPKMPQLFIPIFGLEISISIPCGFTLWPVTVFATDKYLSR